MFARVERKSKGYHDAPAAAAAGKMCGWCCDGLP